MKTGSVETGLQIPARGVLSEFKNKPFHMTPEPLIPWPLETIEDSKDFGNFVGFRIEGHGSVSDMQYLVLTFEKKQSLTHYKVCFTDSNAFSTLLNVIKNASHRILTDFSKFGFGSARLKLAISNSQETVDTVDSKLNEFK